MSGATKAPEAVLRKTLTLTRELCDALIARFGNLSEGIEALCRPALGLGPRPAVEARGRFTSASGRKSGKKGAAARWSGEPPER